MTQRLDPAIRQAVVDGLQRGETVRVIAARHGIGTTSVSRIKASLPEYVVKGTSDLTDPNGGLLQRWTKTRLRGRDESNVFQLPDPKRVVKSSILLDQEGKVVQQWISTKPDEAQRESLWRIAAQELAKSIEYRAPSVPIDPARSYADRCVLVPLGDHHHGMWSSANEGSGEWSLERSEQVLAQSIDELLASTLPSTMCTLIALGDYFHFDGLTAKTPRHGHMLDASGRYADMVRSGIRMLRRTIDRCLQRHERVHLIIAAGNHDEASSVFLREALANIYEDESRLTINRSPKSVHYLEWHRNLIAVHHGDTIKPERLPGVIAADQPEAWGRTTNRLAVTGHVHHHSRREYPGVHIESFGVLAPRDQYAESHGYRSDRSITAIVLDPNRGEVQRHTVRIEDHAHDRP
jgi:UDP-2,3-diacylglucosamine pyrophosphatase LpxH